MIYLQVIYADALVIGQLNRRPFTLMTYRLKSEIPCFVMKKKKASRKANRIIPTEFLDAKEDLAGSSTPEDNLSGPATKKSQIAPMNDALDDLVQANRDSPSNRKRRRRSRKQEVSKEENLGPIDNAEISQPRMIHI